MNLQTKILMKHKTTFSNLLLVLLLLTVSGNASASTTWYVDGVHGSDGNNCKSPSTACKTIGHAILLAASNDTIMVASATYTEHLTIGISLNLIGSRVPAQQPLMVEEQQRWSLFPVPVRLSSSQG